MNPQSTAECARQARRRLPHFLAEYIDGGSHGEQTLARNLADLREIELRQRVLRDVSQVELGLRLFGHDWASPIGLGPVGIAGMLAPRGEVQAARAAAQANVPFCLSTLAVCGLDEIRAALGSPFWFQLYMIRDRGFVTHLLERAQSCNCSALVFTVDMPVPAIRYRDFRTGLSGAPGFTGGVRRALQIVRRPLWLYEVGLRGRPHSMGNLAPRLGKRSSLNDCAGWLARNFDASVTWRDLEWIRSRWTGPLIIKGVLDPEDAREAVRLGAEGIVVSNHGGRQLDGAPSTARALPGIADAVGRDLTILVDGGVRSGVDALRMLALGANGVLLGRAWAYALAAAGGRGVSACIDTMNRELASSMAMAGCTRLSQVARSTLVPRP